MTGYLSLTGKRSFKKVVDTLYSKIFLLKIPSKHIQVVKDE